MQDKEWVQKRGPGRRYCWDRLALPHPYRNFQRHTCHNYPHPLQRNQADKSTVQLMRRPDQNLNWLGRLYTVCC